MARIEELNTDVQTKIGELIDFYRGLAGDGLSLADVWSIVQRAAASFVQVLKLAGGLDAAQRQALALEAVGRLFDALAPLVDVPFVPEIVESKLLDPVLRKAVLQLAQGAIDALNRVLDRTQPPAFAGLQPPVVPRGYNAVRDFEPY